jgi:hypothetical protein
MSVILRASLRITFQVNPSKTSTEAKSINVATGEKSLFIKSNVSLMEISYDTYLEIKFETLSLFGLSIYIKKRAVGTLIARH